ncbi:MAG: alpha/beta hydrolase-fold protein [Pirellulales bacterium]
MQDLESQHSHWEIIDVGGHNCELFTPSKPSAQKGILFLHDNDGQRLRDYPYLRDVIECASIPVIAPRSEQSWWLHHIMPSFDKRISPEQFILSSVKDEMISRFGVRPPSIAIMGVGMGGQGALRISYRHPNVFPIAAALSPSIDFHTAMREADRQGQGEQYESLWELYGDIEKARQDTAILHIHPLNWPRHQFFACPKNDVHWRDGAERLHSKLIALGIPHTAVLESPDHKTDSDFLRFASCELIDFINRALTTESRSVSHS